MKNLKWVEKIIDHIKGFFGKNQNSNVPKGFSKAFYSNGNSVGLVDKNYGIEEFQRKSKEFCENYIKNYKK